MLFKQCSFLLLLFIGLFLLLFSVNAEEQNTRRYQKEIERSYEDVLDDVKFAISEKNFRITGGNRIGGALAERHDEAFPLSDIIHFCNLEYARRFIRLVPDYLRHMPCKVVVYENDGKITVETELLPEDDSEVGKVAQEVNQILKFIVDYATAE